jgi:hypothetical protein
MRFRRQPTCLIRGVDGCWYYVRGDKRTEVPEEVAMDISLAKRWKVRAR